MKIRIISKAEGFRRGGMAHSKTPTDHPADAFTPEQLAVLNADPMLTVEMVEGEVFSAETGEVFEMQTGNFEGEIQLLENEVAMLLEDKANLRAGWEKSIAQCEDLEQQLAGVTKVNQDLAASLEACRLQISSLEVQLKEASTPPPKKAGKKAALDT